MPAWLSRLIRDYHPIDQSKIWKLPGPSYINRSYNPDPELETPSGQTYVNRGKRKGWWAGKIKLLDGLASDRPWMYGPKIKARAKKSEQQIVLLPQMLCLVMNNLDQVTGNQVWQTRLLLQKAFELPCGLVRASPEITCLILSLLRILTISLWHSVTIIDVFIELLFKKLF